MGVALRRRLAHRTWTAEFRPCRKLDDERAALAWRVINLDIAALRPDGSSGDRQPQPQAGAVLRAAFPERLKQVTCSLWNAAARIFHFDPDTRSAGACPQYHPSASRG